MEQSEILKHNYYDKNSDNKTMCLISNAFFDINKIIPHYGSVTIITPTQQFSVGFDNNGCGRDVEHPYIADMMLDIIYPDYESCQKTIEVYSRDPNNDIFVLTMPEQNIIGIIIPEIISNAQKKLLDCFISSIKYCKNPKTSMKIDLKVGNNPRTCFLGQFSNVYTQLVTVEDVDVPQQVNITKLKEIILSQSTRSLENLKQLIQFRLRFCLPIIPGKTRNTTGTSKPSKHKMRAKDRRRRPPKAENKGKSR